jgi:lysophospholipase L1-like esterase
VTGPIQRRGFLKPVLASALGLTVALAGAELGARVFARASTQFFEPDPLIGIRHVPGKSGYWRAPGVDTPITINSHGFRDRERTEQKPAGTIRVIALGDSSTEALQVPEPSTFVSLLERDLDRAGHRVEVLNLGITALGTAQEYKVFEQYGIRYAPDVVLLVFYTCNDVRNNSQRLDHDPALTYPLVEEDGHLIRSQDGQTMWSRPTRPSTVRQFVREHFQLYGVLQEGRLGQLWRFGRISQTALSQEVLRGYGIYKREWSPEWAAAMKTTFELIDELNAAVRRHHAALVVAVLPAPWEVSAAWRRKIGMVDDSWDMEQPQRMLVDFLASRHFPTIPLDRGLREQTASGTDSFLSLDGHLSEAGHRVVSRDLADGLRSMHLVAEAP